MPPIGSGTLYSWYTSKNREEDRRAILMALPKMNRDISNSNTTGLTFWGLDFEESLGGF